VNKIILIVGLLLSIAGAVSAVQTAQFNQKAVEVVGSVLVVEELRGPPKPRQKTPLHVSYQLSDGQQFSAVTHMPLLQAVKQGDQIRLLVDPADPGTVRLPLWSEMWARPLTYLIGGLLVLLAGRVLTNRTTR
jgi:hypothetical protein